MMLQVPVRKVRAIHSFRAAVVLAALLLLPLGTAVAQIQVGLSLPRNLFIRYEPVLATVTITNLSGRPLLLKDADGRQWFSFQIENDRGLPVSPRLTGYGRDPVAIGAGEALRRTINIMPLYALDDFGRYRVRATVFDAETGRYYSSNYVAIEITEGRLIWQQYVGHPEDGSSRRLSLLAHRLPQSTSAYLRIQSPETGRVYAMYRLGPIVTSAKPQVEIDKNNEVHVLQMRAPRRYIYSHIGLNGEIRTRAAYEELPNSKPTLARGPNGEVAVAGGMLFRPEEQAAEQNVPMVGDRPVPMPGLPPPPMTSGTRNQPRQTPPSPSPAATPQQEEERRGGFRIWPFTR